MQDLIELQAELDRERERCWDAMRQAKIDHDQVGYLAAKYEKRAYIKALAMVDRRIHRALQAA